MKIIACPSRASHPIYQHGLDDQCWLKKSSSSAVLELSWVHLEAMLGRRGRRKSSHHWQQFGSHFELFSKSSPSVWVPTGVASKSCWDILKSFLKHFGGLLAHFALPSNCGGHRRNAPSPLPDCGESCRNAPSPCPILRAPVVTYPPIPDLPSTPGRDF